MKGHNREKGKLCRIKIRTNPNKSCEIISNTLFNDRGVRVITWDLGKTSPMLPLPFYTYQDPKFKQ